jgi:hypothetical protein
VIVGQAAVDVPEAGATQKRAAGLPFVANAGQWPPDVAFSMPGIVVSRDGRLAYRLPVGRRRAKLVETFAGGRAAPRPGALAAARVSRFVGDDPSRWQRDVPAYRSVALGDVWPGIAVEVLAQPDAAEKVFTVAAGADPALARMTVHGARRLTPRADGGLDVETPRGAALLTPPVAYQLVDGARRPVEVAYDVRGRTYGFRLGEWDRRRPLVIDPILRATFAGGTEDDLATGVAIHPTSGEVIIAGRTRSADFPGTAGGAQPDNASNNDDAFVARYSADLTTLLQATYFGGTGAEQAPVSVLVHPTSGDVYVVGTTSSEDLPGVTAVTGGAGNGAQTTLNDGTDVFVARFTATLQDVVQATYLGGSGFEQQPALMIHPTSGEVYVATYTSASDFPGTAGGAQTTSGGDDDVAVARLSANLGTLHQSTWFGGTANEDSFAIAAHPTSGEVYVYGSTETMTGLPGVAGGAIPTFVGSGGFVVRFNAALTSRLQSSYLPNASAVQMAFAADGDVYVVGGAVDDVPATTGGFQPDSLGASDAYVLRLDASLTSAVQGTYLGGGESDGAYGIVVDGIGEVIISGSTLSDDLPGTTNAAQTMNGGGFGDVFVARLSGDLTTLVRTTYYGGGETEEPATMAVHPTTGAIYVSGFVDGAPIPNTAGSAQPDSAGEFEGFIVSISADLSDGTVATTTTTIGGGGTTTTTLPGGAACAGLPPLAGLGCRLDALRTAVGAESGLGALQAKLGAKLGKAQTQFAKGETACTGGVAKKAKKPIKKVGKLTGAVAKGLGSKKAKKTVDEAVRAPLQTAATALRDEAKALAKTIVCPP